MGNSVDKIISICDELRTLLSVNGVFDTYGMKLLARLQRLSLQIGFDEYQEDDFDESKHPRDESGRFAEKGGGSGFIQRKISDKIASALKSKKNEAVFFSGCSLRDDDGRIKKKSPSVAREYAENNGGVTMDILLENEDFPEWDFGDEDSFSRWEDASRAYAEQASGDVRVIARPPIRKGSIFEAVEFPTLKKNKNVTSVTMINPETGEKTVIFRR